MNPVPFIHPLKSSNGMNYFLLARGGTAPVKCFQENVRRFHCLGALLVDIAIDAGKTMTFTAPSKPGAYGFHCNIHTFMKATLTVT